MSSFDLAPRSRRASTIVLSLLALAPFCVLLGMGWSRRWLDEDAFINLRIVRNILSGYGPVFNVGERVEAGTSPMWLAVLTLSGALGLHLEPAAAFLGIALTLLGLLVAQWASSGGDFGGESAWGGRGKRAAIPLGAAIFAVVPAAWDYASSGLETGLTIAWLGVAYAALSHRVRGSSPRLWRTLLTAMLLGAGPLVRPELALYSAAFSAVLAFQLVAERAAIGAIPTIAGAAVAAALLPVSYQLFRMGYYGSVVPNTAIAKEAFLANWEQGRFYFQNFFGTYWLAWPLGTAAVVLLLRIISTERSSTSNRFARVLLLAAPPFAAAAHVVYLVRMGGDYMHGRLLVPALFGALLPVASVPLLGAAPLMTRRAQALSLLLAVPWLFYAPFALHVGAENVHDIGDERAWYAREAKNEHPITLEDYRPHTFFREAETALANIRTRCPKGRPDCRFVYLDETGTETAPLTEETDQRITAVVSLGAVGISGYDLPASTHVMDRHGLADPFVSRLEIGRRGRPGHEKVLPLWWMAARFGAPDPSEDAAVTAARHALACGDLAAIDRAVRAPLTRSTIWSNLRNASAYARVRLPADPFDAEERFCQTPKRPEVFAGGTGGESFRWLCREGTALVAVRGSVKDKDQAIASLQPVCEAPNAIGAEAEEKVAKPAPLYGEKGDGDFELACPHGARVMALYGTANSLARSLGLVCGRDGDARRTETVSEGAPQGGPFELGCPDRAPVVGLSGRAGALIDSVGIVCPSPVGTAAPQVGQAAFAAGDGRPSGR